MILLGLVVALTARASAQTITMSATRNPGAESESTQVTASFNDSGRLYHYQWVIDGGTADYNTNGPDYAIGTTQSERLNLPFAFVPVQGSGASTQSIWLNINDDSLDEPDETIEIRFQTKDLQGGKRSFTYTITDNDPTIVSLEKVTPGNLLGEGSTITFRVTLGRALVAGEIIDVPLSISGTGITTGDWSLAKAPGSSLNTGVTLSGTGTSTPKVRFSGAGAGTATLQLAATADSTSESSEILNVALGPDGTGTNGFGN